MAVGRQLEFFVKTLYADLILDDGAGYKVECGHIERAMHVAEGSVDIIGQNGSFGKDQLVVFKPGAEIIIKASRTSRLMLLGGEPLRKSATSIGILSQAVANALNRQPRIGKNAVFPVGQAKVNLFLCLPDVGQFMNAMLEEGQIPLSRKSILVVLHLMNTAFKQRLMPDT